MPSRRLGVVVTRRLPERVETRLKDLFDVTLGPQDRPMSRDELVQAVRHADVLVPNLRDVIDQSLLSQAGDQLRLIANYGAGVDHIDVATARQRGILVSNTPDVVTEDTADMTIALILALLRRVPEGLAMMQADEWTGWSPNSMLGSRITGKRIGILGMGRIGQAVARRARAFGMQIHYHTRRRLREETEAELSARYWESLDQMVARMDVISVNCPHTPATHMLLSRERLSRMQPSAYLVNASRGEVVDEQALGELLAAGHIAGAGLDVYANEPHIPDTLRALKNVVLLPHIGSATIEGRLEMGDKVIINVQTFWDGHSPPDRVIEAML